MKNEETLCVNILVSVLCCTNEISFDVWLRFGIFAWNYTVEIEFFIFILKSNQSFFYQENCVDQIRSQKSILFAASSIFWMKHDFFIFLFYYYCHVIS